MLSFLCFSRNLFRFTDFRVLNTNVVGFTAILSKSVIDLPMGSPVVYDRVFIFTCPRSGIYLFYINVEAVDESLPASIAILLNGSYRVASVSERYDANHDSTGGNLMVEHIQEGDRVWVETYLRDNQDLYESFTTFSGVLIEST